MAFMENKLQMIDLLGALAAKQKSRENEKAQELQNQLMQQQLEAMKWQNMKDREVQTMTVPSSGLTGMPTKKFLHEMPGYISGVDPTEVFKEWNQNFRQGMTAGGGGGRTMPEQTDDEKRIVSAQADIAEEKARQEQYQRQGYGGASANLLAQQLADAKMQGSYDRQYDNMIKDIQGASKDRWADIKAGDQKISDAKTQSSQMQNEIDKTKGAQAEKEYADFENSILNSPAYSGISKQDKKKEIYSQIKRFKNELDARGIRPTESIISGWISQFKK